MNNEEKLKEAKRLYQTANSDQRYVLEILFPELAESKDEKIRKWLICGMNALKEQKTETFATIPIDDAIAWLEKQGEKDKVTIKKGEQEPTWSEKDEAGLCDALWAIKQAKKIAKDENDMGNLWYAENWLKSLKQRIVG